MPDRKALRKASIATTGTFVSLLLVILMVFPVGPSLTFSAPAVPHEPSRAAVGEMGTIPGRSHEGVGSTQLVAGGEPRLSGPGVTSPRALPPGGELPRAGSARAVEATPSAPARFLGAFHPFGVKGSVPDTPASSPSGAARPSLPRSASTLVNGTHGWNGSDYIAGKLYPPDGGLAIGRGYVVEEINANFRIWTTSGTYLTQASMDQFWGTTAFLGDPAILYDDEHDHFIALTINITTNLLIFSVSQTGDPTGSWWEYILPTIGPNLPDQPFIGIDSNTFLVTANDAGSTTYEYEAWFLNLSALESGAKLPATQTVSPSASLNCVRPVRIYEPTSTGYMVGDDLGGGTTTVSLFVVTGSPPATVTVTEHDFTTATASVPQGTQPSGASVNTDDGRVVGTAWRNGVLWATANDGCSASSVACSHFWKFDTSTLALQQDFTWVPPGTGVNDYYAAPAIDVYGDLGVVASFSSSTIYPSVLITGQSVTDSPSTLETPVVVKPGYGDEMYGRFGDYNTADVDPTNGVSLWVEGEWIPGDTGTDYWSTWIQNFTFTPPTVQVNVVIIPAGSGSLTIGGSTYYNGSVATLMVGSYPLGVNSGAGHRFSGFSASGGVTPGGGLLVVNSAGTVQANFLVHPAISFATVPTSCSPLTFNGSAQPSGSSASYDRGTYLIKASACPGFRFIQWSSTGGLSLSGTASMNASATVTNNGTLTATWQWVPIPTYTVTVSISTASCASSPLTLNGTFLSSGGSATLRAGTYALSVSPCPQHRFGQWNASGHSGVGSPTQASSLVNISGNGSLSAFFAPTFYTVTVHVIPGSCTLKLNGATLSNNSAAALKVGNYSLLASACSGFVHPSLGFLGLLRANGASLVEVLGNGTLTATYWPVLSVSLSGTSSLQAGGTAGLNASLIGGRLPMTLWWRFGDGNSATTQLASGGLAPEHHLYASGGTYTVEVTANDSSGQQANATFVVNVASPPSAFGPLGELLGSPWAWLLILALVAVVVIAAVLVHRRKKRNAGGMAPEGAGPYYPPGPATAPMPPPYPGGGPGYEPMPPPPPSGTWAPAPAAQSGPPPPVWPPPPV
ncbi:MAG: hypothetical protein KGJ69_16145 [Thermoplasmata archaeon]|nr:hypothetical protein [Thermoplasmata archaeon]